MNRTTRTWIDVPNRVLKGPNVCCDLTGLSTMQLLVKDDGTADVRLGFRSGQDESRTEIVPLWLLQRTPRGANSMLRKLWEDGHRLIVESRATVRFSPDGHTLFCPAGVFDVSGLTRVSTSNAELETSPNSTDLWLENGTRVRVAWTPTVEDLFVLDKKIADNVALSKRRRRKLQRRSLAGESPDVEGPREALSPSVTKDGFYDLSDMDRGDANSV